ncbi:MAG: tetratricopeptide repeat protein [Elusimicrobiota bacterium]|jgi:tetratricopeptide (TPR) repeat protein
MPGPRDLFAAALQEGQAGRLRSSRDLVRRFLAEAGPELAEEIGMARKLLAATRLSEKASELNGSGRFAEALAAAEDALKANDRSAAAWYHRAYALDELGRDDEAVASYGRAVELAPDYESAWNNRAALLCALKRYEESLMCWDRLITLHPGEGRFLDRKAKALHAMGRVEEAVDLTMKALEDPAFAAEYDKGSKDLLAAMGVAPVELNRSAERLERQTSARPVPPETKSWMDKARDFLTQRSPEAMAGALSAAEKALELAPGHPLALYFKGVALWGLGRACESSRTMTAFKAGAWANMPKEVEIADDILRTFRGAGVPTGPVDPDAERRIDEAYSKYESVQKPDAAFCSAVLGLYRGHPNAWYSMAQCLAASGKKVEAAACFLEAGRLIPEFSEAWTRGSVLLLDLGRTAECLDAALKGLASAPEADPNHAKLRSLKVTCLIKLGRTDEGLAEVDAMLADPSLDPKLREALALAKSSFRADPGANVVSQEKLKELGGLG